MADVFDRATRSKNMSRIRGKHTKPEQLIRSALHSRGFRYRLHSKDLPGKPDIVLPKYKAIIEVNGCFWHGHKCHLFHWPKSRTDFWREKITQNIRRDSENQIKLENMGWRVLVVWECSIKGKKRLNRDELIDRIVEWLITNKDSKQLFGQEID